MRLVVLSDIHGNLEALQAVLRDASEVAPGTQLVCLGDIVGYGADPEEAVRVVRGAGVLSVLGNHEMGVNDPSSRGRFDPQAWESVKWACSKLSAESRSWLNELPVSLSLGGCRFVHGLPPDEVDTYLFQASTGHVVRVMTDIPEDVSFVGHTHQLQLVSLREGRLDGTPLSEGRQVLEPGVRHIVNAGAVGQPRDGNPRAKYCLYDTQSRELTVRFVSYDTATAAKKIIAAGQPRVYAERLSAGGV
jgi:diadenosine tetraphosphatase ApaH/serine/threonine PP2A family protein phosphatase